MFNFSGQSLIAKRGVNLSYQAEISVIFNPENYRQIAGLIVYYDSHSFTYLTISADDAGRKNLNTPKVKNEFGGGKNYLKNQLI